MDINRWTKTVTNYLLFYFCGFILMVTSDGSFRWMNNIEMLSVNLDIFLKDDFCSWNEDFHLNLKELDINQWTKTVANYLKFCAAVELILLAFQSLYMMESWFRYVHYLLSKQKSILNIERIAHQLPQYYQPHQVLSTAWTVSVTQYTNGKFVSIKILQNFWLAFMELDYKTYSSNIGWLKYKWILNIKWNTLNIGHEDSIILNCICKIQSIYKPYVLIVFC